MTTHLLGARGRPAPAGVLADMPGPSPADLLAGAPPLSSEEFRVAYAQARAILTTGWPRKVRPLLRDARRSRDLLHFVRELPLLTLPAAPRTAALAEALAEPDAGWHRRGVALAQSALLLAEEADSTVGSGNSAKSLRKQLNRAHRAGLRVDVLPGAAPGAALDRIWAGHTAEPLEAPRRRRVLGSPACWVAVRDADGELLNLGAVLLGDGRVGRWEFSVSLPHHALRKEARFLAHRSVTEQLREQRFTALLAGSALHLNEGVLNFQRVFGYRTCSVAVSGQPRQTVPGGPGVPAQRVPGGAEIHPVH